MQVRQVSLACRVTPAHLDWLVVSEILEPSALQVFTDADDGVLYSADCFNCIYWKIFMKRK